MFHTKQQIINNVYFGLALGYNECCIRHFHIRQANGSVHNFIIDKMNGKLPMDAILEGDKKLSGTGFICCDECNEKYTEQELIDRINYQRVYKNSFPDSQDFEFTKDHFKQIDIFEAQSLIKEIIQEVEEYIELEG